MAYCTNPNFHLLTGFTACGKCPGCLLNKKKEWADRLKIEMRYHTHNYFVGLTYSPEFYPDDGSLSKKVAQKFKKRLEYFFGETPRTFMVGEYGDESERAHYHVCVFADRDCFDAIRKAWIYGNVDIEHLTPGRCNYSAGYVTKKMTKKDDSRLNGREPEFFLASRKPALGYQLLYEILERMATDDTFREHIMRYPYPPHSVKIGGKWIRLPRYIRDKLSPWFKEYNHEVQKVKKREKVAQDCAVAKKIHENLSDMHGLNYMGRDSVLSKWKYVKDLVRAEGEKREKLNAKAEKLKNRRYL